MVGFLKEADKFKGTSTVTDAISWKHSSDGRLYVNRVDKLEVLGQLGSKACAWSKVG